LQSRPHDLKDPSPPKVWEESRSSRSTTKVPRAPVPKYSATAVDDRYGRTLAQVVAQQHRAVAIAERLDEIVAAIEGEEVLLVRAAGPRLEVLRLAPPRTR
jgi:hypothetical protein